MIVEFKKSGGSYVDISDYVIESNDMPLYERNRDWTPIISDFTLSISQAFNQIPDLNDIIRVTLSSSYIRAFIITGRDFDYANKLWKVTCKLNLSLLQSKILCRDNLHSKLTATGGDKEKYCLGDNWGENNFGLLWVLQNMFTDVGLTLDTSTVINDFVGYYPRSGEPMYPSPLVQNNCVYGQDIKVDEVMLYMSGVQCATLDYNTDGNGHYYYDVTKRISYWEYITNIIAMIGWQLINTGENSYALVAYQSQFTCSDDVKYDYRKPRNYKQYSRVTYSILSATRSYFYQTSTHATDQNYGYNQSPTPDYTITFPANMILLFRDKWTATAGAVRASYMLPWFDYPYASYFARDNMRDSFRKDYDEEEITTDITLGNYECTSHFIDLANRHSIIKQETKL